MTKSKRHLPNYDVSDMRRALEHVWQTPGVLFPLSRCCYTVSVPVSDGRTVEAVHIAIRPGTGTRVEAGFTVADIPLPAFEGARLWAFPAPQRPGKK